MVQKIIGAVVVIAFIGWMVMDDRKERESKSQSVLAESQFMFSRMEGHEKDKEYLDAVVSRAHEPAFSLAYKASRRGRRFRASEPASFDEERYLAALFTQMRAIIQGDINNAGGAGDRARYESIKRSVEALKKEMKVGEHTGS